MLYCISPDPTLSCQCVAGLYNERDVDLPPVFKGRRKRAGELQGQGSCKDKGQADARSTALFGGKDSKVGAAASR